MGKVRIEIDVFLRSHQKKVSKDKSRVSMAAEDDVLFLEEIKLPSPAAKEQSTKKRNKQQNDDTTTPSNGESGSGNKSGGGGGGKNGKSKPPSSALASIQQQIETITLDDSVEVQVRRKSAVKSKKVATNKSPLASSTTTLNCKSLAKSKKTSKETAKNTTTANKSPPRPDRIMELRDLIFSVLKFDNIDKLVSIPKVDPALNKIYSARDLLSEWISCLEDNDTLNVVRVHFEALESMLSALIEDHKCSVNSSTSSKRTEASQRL